MLPEQLPRPEIRQLGNVRRPVDPRRGEDWTQDIVHRDLPVEAPNELLDVAAVIEIVLLLVEHMRPAGWVPADAAAIGRRTARASTLTSGN